MHARPPTYGSMMGGGGMPRQPCARAPVLQALLKAGAKVDATDSDGWTPLRGAASEGHARVVEALLRARASPAIKDHNGKTPLAVAQAKGHADVVKLLRDAGAKV